jgi:hypothetical protein
VTADQSLTLPTLTVTDRSTLTGPGTITIPSAGTATVSGSVSGSGDLTISGTANVAFGGALARTGALSIPTGGTATIAGAVTIPVGGTGAIAGTVTGSGSFTIAGSATMSQPTMAGSGTTTVESGATVSLAGMSLARPLVNAGTINWVSGALFASSGSLTNNGTLNLKPTNPNSDPYLVDQSGGTFAFVNSGPIILNGAAGTAAELDALSSDTGQITVSSGTLTLRPPAGATVPLSTGPIVAGGGTMNLASAPSGAPGGFVLPSGQSLNQTGTGTATLTIGESGLGSSSNPGVTVELAGTDNLPALTVASGAILELDTTTQVIATYQQLSGSTMVSTVSSATSYGTIVASGTASISGTVQLTLVGSTPPAVGSQLKVVKATGGLSGTFTAITSPPGETYKASYNPTTAILRRAS